MVDGHRLLTRIDDHQLLDAIGHQSSQHLDISSGRRQARNRLAKTAQPSGTHQSPPIAKPQDIAKVRMPDTLDRPIDSATVSSNGYISISANGRKINLFWSHFLSLIFLSDGRSEKKLSDRRSKVLSRPNRWPMQSPPKMCPSRTAASAQRLEKSIDGCGQAQNRSLSQHSH